MNMFLLLLGAPSHKHSFPKLWQARNKCNFILQGPLPEQYFISYQQFMISGAECERLSVGLQRLSINILRGFFENCVYDRYRHDNHSDLSLQFFLGSDA